MTVARRLQELGPYRMGERLGIGGMAEVFSAESKLHGRIALKRILPGLAEDTEFADMFWDEARITSRLDHPNIIKILDYGRIDSELYMALEYVAGPTLARVLRKAAKARLRFDLSALVGMIVELLDALHYVHTAKDSRGNCLDIVHRDVSPGNVILTAEGQVKLGDFGILRSQAVVRRTLPGELKGKMGYMSPEQALGEAVGCRSDLFSVGIVMAEFLTMRPLFLGKNEMHTLSRTVSVDLQTWHRHNRHVPASLCTVVEKALKQEVTERYQSADEMREALLNVAIANSWELSRVALLSQLRKLELLPGEQQASGERRIVGRIPLPESGPREALTRIDSGGGGPSVDSFSHPQEKPVWSVGFTRVSLPTCLFSAFRRAPNGLVQLTSQDAQRTLSIELREGRIFSVHDSEAHLPLGRMLQDCSLLNAGELSLAIEESRRVKLRLGQYLVLHGRLRESTLVRLLAEQGGVRIGRWFQEPKGKLKVFPQGASADNNGSDGESWSLAALISAMRDSLSMEDLACYLESVQDAVVLPAPGIDVAPFALTGPERRALNTALEGGAYEGRSIRRIIQGVEEERIARKREAMFALLVGLSAGLILASGFGR